MRSRLRFDSSSIRLHHFWRFFFPMLKKKTFFFQKLAGLWLVGEVANHVGLYGSKVAEGCSAFQRRSCLLCCRFGTFAQSILCFRHMAIALLSLILFSFLALFILLLFLLPHIMVIFLAKLIDTADAITQLAAVDCYIVGINPHTIHKNMQFQLGDEPSLRYVASLWSVLKGNIERHHSEG